MRRLRHVFGLGLPLGGLLTLTLIVVVAAPSALTRSDVATVMAGTTPRGFGANATTAPVDVTKSVGAARQPDKAAPDSGTSTATPPAMSSPTPAPPTFAINWPAPGSTLPAGATAFSWTTVSGADQYDLYVGTTAGGSDLFNSGDITGTSATALLLPAVSSSLYATIWASVGGSWLHQTFTYAATAFTPTSPIAGSALTAGAVTFNWPTVSGADQYDLYLGTTAGAADLYNSGDITGTTANALVLPASGGSVYATLWCRIEGSWVHGDATYTMAAAFAMTSPTLGSTLSSGTTTFRWSSLAGATQYDLYVGTNAGDSDLFNSGPIAGTSAEALLLPSSDGTAYATVWAQIDGAWLHQSFTYTLQPSFAISTPAPGSTLSGGAVSFTWNAVAGADQYDLYVGTTSGGSELFNSGNIAGTSTTALLIMTTTGTSYATLWARVGGTWVHQSATYTLEPTFVITSPTPGSTLTAGPTHVAWNGIAGADQYVLYVGSSAGASDLANSGPIAGTSTDAVLTPTAPGAVYVTLWARIGGAWLNQQFTYADVSGVRDRTTRARR